MIEIKGTNINNIECYLLIMRKKTFLFLSKPNLSNLKHFTNTSLNIKENIKINTKYQQKKKYPNPIQQQQQQYHHTSKVHDFSKLKIHLDLNYIKDILNTAQHQSDQTPLYIMITHYQDFIVLPYILRKFKNQNQIKVFCTHIAYQMGRIYLKRFFETIFHFDLLYSEPKGLSYDQQSKLQDQFYLKFGVQIKTWTKLFSKQDMQECLTFVNKMNYGQIYDCDGVKFRPFPSGHSLGSSLWMLQNTLTKQTVMLIRQISSQTWRSISQNNLFFTQKLLGYKQKDFQNIDLLIFANNSLVTHQKQKTDAEVLKLMKAILQNLQKGINNEIILQDELLVLDIIDFINFQMKDKFRGLFLENSQFNQIVSYANSYVQFLSPQYKQKIYQDPPQYPFQAYLILRQKGFLSAGSLYEICERQKIPLKELMRKSAPYIHFKSDYEAYLTGVNDQKTPIYKQKDYLSPQSLNSLLSNVNPKRIISFSNIVPFIESKFAQNTGVIDYGKQFVINSQPYHHYISKNISPNIINKYEFVDGFLMAYPVNRQFLRLGSSWKEQIQKHLKDNFRQVLGMSQNGLRTKSASIWVENYEIFIKSSDINQVQFILQIISAITKTLRLK